MTPATGSEQTQRRWIWLCVRYESIRLGETPAAIPRESLSNSDRDHSLSTPPSASYDLSGI